MEGPIMAGCLGEDAERTGKGTGSERIWHSVQRSVNHQQGLQNCRGRGKESQIRYLAFP